MIKRGLLTERNENQEDLDFAETKSSQEDVAETIETVKKSTIEPIPLDITTEKIQCEKEQVQLEDQAVSDQKTTKNQSNINTQKHIDTALEEFGFGPYLKHPTIVAQKPIWNNWLQKIR